MAVRKPAAVDLFCGAGGLTLGLKKAGFKVVAGVETDAEIVRTYQANHPEVRLLVKDVRDVTGAEILKAARRKKVDLLAGCPPCQGFCQLTRKYRKHDARNDLVLEMGRLVVELQPSIVMMENVPGITSRGKTILRQFLGLLHGLGYKVDSGIVEMADYGVPQMRRRFVLLAGKGFPVRMPSPTHSRDGDKKNGLRPWITLYEVIGNMGKPVTLSETKRKGGPSDFDWHVVRDIKPITRQRLSALSSGDDRSDLPQSLRPMCHKETDEGFKNVYGRMEWDDTPPTITGGCTTLSMGRFGHPEQLRTISVREAAMIQTFPKYYRFHTRSIEVACNMVGSALPYRFALKASKCCRDALRPSQGPQND